MANDKSVMTAIRASRPSFRNNNDKVAFVVHASFLAADYTLTATGPPALSDGALSSSSTDEVGIDRWNELEEEYGFVYESPGGKKVLVKCLVMNGKLLVDALADGASEPVHTQINIPEYVEDKEGGKYSELFKNLDKLVKKLDAEILTKLDGRPPSKPSSSSVEASDRSRNDRSEPGIGVTDPSSFVVPPFSPFSDNAPGPGAGIYPTRGDGLGGSMLIGPNDPRWFGGTRGELGFADRLPGVPPGSRFDPIGPPEIPGFEPGRFMRIPRRPGGGHHPDLEQPGAGGGAWADTPPRRRHFGTDDFI